MTAPVVYFIDDSATMREVIKIAFRRENIEVVACHDGDSAIAQMLQQKPDVVITDVIMPGKDGYEVCQSIKQNPSTAGTPVVLMSGVVNRQVAEKAFAVKADELIRKPFQPGDLIGRVKDLLTKSAQPSAPAPVVPISQPVPQPQLVPQVQAPVQPVANAAATLSNIFNAPPRANGNGHANGNGEQPALRNARSSGGSCRASRNIGLSSAHSVSNRYIWSRRGEAKNRDLKARAFG